MKLLFYNLARRYGGSINVYHGSTSSDPKTGERTISREVVQVKAIILPAEVARRMVSLPGFDSGPFDESSRVFIVNSQITKNDWIVYAGVRYDVDSFHELLGVWIIVAKTIGQATDQIHVVSADSLLNLGSHA